MEKLIKTENYREFIANYLVGCSRYNDPMMDCRPVDLVLANEIIISDKADLKDGDSIRIEVEGRFNSRCKLTQSYVYDIIKYDSVSVKGLLKSYSIAPNIINN